MGQPDAHNPNPVLLRTAPRLVRVRTNLIHWRGRNIRIVAFDKTGTLTEGRFAVSAVTTDGLERDVALALAAGLERASEHPLATAVVEAANEANTTVAEAVSVTAVPGHGLQGTIGGQTLRIGRPEWSIELGIEPSPLLDEALSIADRRAESAVVLMGDDTVLGVIAVSDRVREQSRATIDRLRSMGMRTVMITGDSESVAATVAADLEVDEYHSPLSGHTWREPTGAGVSSSAINLTSGYPGSGLSPGQMEDQS